MSRRESRVSMGARQNDALLEFETFKKKFLLANKHITKLNSTLSVRIEELNAQISSLYVENLRLRASEIALASQLKREREKSRKVMAETEAATVNLTKQITYIRQSFNITSTSPAPIAPASPRARRPPSNPNPTPNTPNRISRQPNVPGINEEEEPSPSSSEEYEHHHSPVHRKVKSNRLSVSRLPLLARVSPSQQLRALTPEMDLGSVSKPRRPSRRQSGLLSVKTESLSVPRSPSPAFGSPIRRAAGLAEEEEEIAVSGQSRVEDRVEVFVEEEVKIPVKKERRKSRGKSQEGTEEKGTDFGVALPHERKRTKEKTEEDLGTDGGGKPGLKNFTNSRAALSPIGNTVRDQDMDARAFLETSSTPPVSSPSPAPAGDYEGLHSGGRERRTRKSVNYAEPKLNTKMRKPDPSPGTALPSKKHRSSAAAVLTTYKPVIEDNGNEADNDTEARSSLEFPVKLRVNGNVINPESFPLPPSRPSSSASLFSPPPGIVRTSSSSTAASSSSSSSEMSLKRKKSRPRILVEEDESDGAQADAEYGVGKAAWINTDGRRKTGTKRSLPMVDDARRHSMVV